MAKMPAISIDDGAKEAAKQNNCDVVGRVEKATEGGNIAKLCENNSSVKPESAAEITMIEYKGSCAVEFIILAMIKCWTKPLEGQAEEMHKEEEVKPEENLLPVTKSEEEEKAKAAAEAKKKEDAKKKEEVPEIKVCKTCPIFDSACVGIGISNMRHPSQTNVIQMLFVKTKANAMD